MLFVLQFMNRKDCNRVKFNWLLRAT